MKEETFSTWSHTFIRPSLCVTQVDINLVCAMFMCALECVSECVGGTTTTTLKTGKR